MLTKAQYIQHTFMINYNDYNSLALMRINLQYLGFEFFLQLDKLEKLSILCFLTAGNDSTNYKLGFAAL